MRQDPFDGLTPLDFVAPHGTWPEGPFVRAVANRLGRDVPVEQREAADRAAMLAEEAVHELAEEVAVHLRWRRRMKVPASTVARHAGVSRARIAAFEHGTNWPRWDLLMRLRVLRDTYEADD
ncbi:hypothetical protein SAMN06893097_104232 [Geodermatophilus sabuli]|uniref:Uncharacterized protein n=1 Tax=Geodermatophilus sabuli TaxID=1564158 RepID=A0A285EC01_9ACTN|nr:hypothetical protein SAMN06893097_104232 [Geodermatophilus sabuli]